MLGSLAACAAPPDIDPIPTSIAPVAPVAVAPAPVPTIPSEARALIGRTAGEVAEWLGPPQLKRRERAAELWQYRPGGCVLDLFLYADAAHAAATVAHVETRPREDGGKECLSAIRAAARAASGG